MLPNNGIGANKAKRGDYVNLLFSLEVPKNLGSYLKTYLSNLVIFTQSISMIAGKLASSIGPGHEPGLSPPSPMFRMR